MDQTIVYCFSLFFINIVLIVIFICLVLIVFSRVDFSDLLNQQKIVLKLKEKHMVRQTKKIRENPDRF